MSLLLEALKKAELEQKAKQATHAGRIPLALEEPEPAKSAEHDAQVKSTVPQQTLPPASRNPAQNASVEALSSKLRQHRHRRVVFSALSVSAVLSMFVVGWVAYRIQSDDLVVFVSPGSGMANPRSVNSTVSPEHAGNEANNAAPTGLTDARDHQVPGALVAASAAPIDHTPSVAVAQPAIEAVVEQKPLAQTTAPRIQPETPTLAQTRNSEPKPITPLRTMATPPAPATPPPVQVQKEVPVQHRVQEAYAFYLVGNFPQAKLVYLSVLERQPHLRDAILGLAAIALREGQHQTARTLYLDLLQRNPADNAAKAGLLHLLGNNDPDATESEFKSLLRVDPQAHYLHFYLGIALGRQNRWSDAKHHFLQAAAAAPGNADYAYNLAVSLDHLQDHAQALRWYEQVQRLGGASGQGTNAELNARIAQLRRRTEPHP